MGNCALGNVVADYVVNPTLQTRAVGQFKIKEGTHLVSNSEFKPRLCVCVN